jgi:hypothetical protein
LAHETSIQLWFRERGTEANDDAAEIGVGAIAATAEKIIEESGKRLEVGDALPGVGN